MAVEEALDGFLLFGGELVFVGHFFVVLCGAVWRLATVVGWCNALLNRFCWCVFRRVARHCV
jgi:hypothetical protein